MYAYLRLLQDDLRCLNYMIVFLQYRRVAINNYAYIIFGVPSFLNKFVTYIQILDVALVLNCRYKNKACKVYLS